MRAVLRHLVQVLLLGALAAAAGAGCGDAPAAPPQPEPEAQHPLNVLLVVMDTTRADRCSFLGYERPTTPYLDRLAAESVVYSNAWVPAGWTGPAHGSMFTGLRPRKHGFIEQRLPVLPSSAVTLAEILAEAGWKTAALSNNLVVSGDFGLVQGFEHAPRIALMKERELPLARDALDRTLEFIDVQTRTGHPYFVYVNVYEPHLPYEPAAEFQDRFLRQDPLPNVLAAARAWNNPTVLAQMLGLMSMDPQLPPVLRDLYDAEIAWLDAELATFFEALRARGELERTLVIVTSDHGENLGEHGLWDHRFSLHGTIRHVPLLLRHPDRRAAGTVVADVVRIEDIMPTVIERVGLPVPDGLDGESLLGPVGGRLSRASYGPQVSVLPHIRELFPDASDVRFRHSQEAVFDGRYHLIVRSDGHVELFDHATDPGETTNVADAHPDVVERLRPLLDG